MVFVVCNYSTPLLRLRCRWSILPQPTDLNPDHVAYIVQWNIGSSSVWQWGVQTFRCHECVFSFFCASVLHHEKSVSQVVVFFWPGFWSERHLEPTWPGPLEAKLLRTSTDTWVRYVHLLFVNYWDFKVVTQHHHRNIWLIYNHSRNQVYNHKPNHILRFSFFLASELRAKCFEEMLDHSYKGLLLCVGKAGILYLNIKMISSSIGDT